MAPKKRLPAPTPQGRAEQTGRGAPSQSEGEERSILRNPLIAHTLYLCKDIERWGSGIRRIAKECEEHNVKVDFKKLKSGFVVVFYRMEMVGESSEKTSEKVDEGVGDGLVDGLVETQILMLQLMKENPHVSKREMAESVGISTTAIDKNIVSLKKKGLLKRIGPDKGGYWEVVEG